jgi:hypothetical protein
MSAKSRGLVPSSSDPRSYYRKQAALIAACLVVGCGLIAVECGLIIGDAHMHQGGEIVIDLLLILGGLGICLLGLAGWRRRIQMKRETPPGEPIRFRFRK